MLNGAQVREGMKLLLSCTLRSSILKIKKIRNSDFFSDGATVRCDVQELEHRVTEEEQIEGL